MIAPFLIQGVRLLGGPGQPLLALRGPVFLGPPGRAGPGPGRDQKRPCMYYAVKIILPKQIASHNKICESTKTIEICKKQMNAGQRSEKGPLPRSL